MSVLFRKSFIQIRSSCLQLKRFRGKINIQRPQKPHYERARLIAVTNPIYPRKDAKENCLTILSNQVQEEIINPYEKIIAKEVINWHNHSKVIVVFHLNSIKQDELFKTQVALHKHNVQLKSYGRSIMRLALTDTKYETMLPLFESKYCILFSTENKIQQILKITKKVPQMILIAGILEDRLLSKNEIIQYSTMPDITVARAQFVSTLNSIAGNLVKQLESHQNNLVNILDTHARINSTEKDTNSNKELKNDTNKNSTE